MSSLDRMLDLLPPPYTIAADSMIAALLNVVALEVEAYQEDLDLYQRSHWIGTVFRLLEAEKIAALVGIQRLDWENLDTFRERLLPLIVALRQGSVGPVEIRRFVFDYLRRMERVLGAVYVPDLQSFRDEDAESAYQPLPGRPKFRPLGLVENPVRQHVSGTLRPANGRVPYLYRWEESNGGLDESLAAFEIAGAFAGTPVPILLNRTTGDLIGFKGRLRFGQTLAIDAAAPGARDAVALLDGAPATDRVFTAHGFALGDALTPDKVDARPQLPRMARGANDWIFLAIGIYDIRGLNRFFFAMPDDELREGAFDNSRFDHAVFPSGTAAHIRMAWTETEPASFEVVVPRAVITESGDDTPRYPQVAEALAGTIQRLHAAGVRAAVRFDPFTEQQPQLTRFRLGVKTLDPETGPAGERDSLAIGGRFGDSKLGSSRFD